MMRTRFVFLLLIFSLLLAACSTAQAICDPGIRLIVQGLKLSSGLSILEYAEVNFSAPDLRASVADVGGQSHCQLRFYVQETDSNSVMGIQVNMESGEVSGIDAAAASNPTIRKRPAKRCWAAARRPARSPWDVLCFFPFLTVFSGSCAET